LPSLIAKTPEYENGFQNRSYHNRGVGKGQLWRWPNFLHEIANIAHKIEDAGATRAGKLSRKKGRQV
jgi:hypothetical protein